MTFPFRRMNNLKHHQRYKMLSI